MIEVATAAWAPQTTSPAAATTTAPARFLTDIRHPPAITAAPACLATRSTSPAQRVRSPSRHASRLTACPTNKLRLDPRLKSLAVHLLARQHLPYEGCAELPAD
jgi:hypothetical protein